MTIEEQIEGLRLYGFYATQELESDDVADTLERLNAVYGVAENIVNTMAINEACHLGASVVGELRTKVAAVQENQR